MSAKKNKNTVLAHKGKLYRRVMLGSLFSSWVEDEKIRVETREPKTDWLGEMIPFPLWEMIVSFMLWSQKEFKSEALLNLYYHPGEGKWDAWVFPQYTMGMTVSFATDHPRFKEDRKRFGSSWIQAGTVHHHCNASAFQSGTDKSDEEDKEGVHFTLGNLESQKLDIHCRQVVGTTMEQVNPFEWVDYPDAIAATARWITDEVFQQACLNWLTGKHSVDFPKEWRDNVMRRPINGPSLPGAGFAYQVGGYETDIDRWLKERNLRGAGTILTGKNEKSILGDEARAMELVNAFVELMHQINIFDIIYLQWLLDSTAAEYEAEDTKLWSRMGSFMSTKHLNVAQMDAVIWRIRLLLSDKDDPWTKAFWSKVPDTGIVSVCKAYRNSSKTKADMKASVPSQLDLEDGYGHMPYC